MDIFDGIMMDLDSDEVTVTGDNEVFKDTPWEGKDFKIYVSPVTLKEYTRMKKRYMKKRTGDIDEESFETDLFMRQVKDWEGFRDPNKKDILCNEETKKAIVSKVFLFAKAINLACLNARSDLQETERKNLKDSGAGD